MSDVDLPRNVLFVGEGPIAPIETSLASSCPTWTVEQARSFGEALTRIESEPQLDAIVVTEIRPELRVESLLAAATEVNPRLAHLLITEDRHNPLSERTLCHEQLIRPVDVVNLREAIVRSTTVKIRMHDPALAELLQSVDSFPSPPALMVELNSLLAHPDVEISQIASLVESDVAMTARVLQLVNSAAFGLVNQVGNVDRAITFLGLRTLADLIGTLMLFDSLTERSSELDEELYKISAHSYEVALRARAYDTSSEAYVAGLLHDVGLMALAVCSPTRYLALRNAAMNDGGTLEKCELEVLGTSHATIGATLLENWSFPWSIVEAVARSHDADESPELGSMAQAVFIAERSVCRERLDGWWETAAEA